MPVLLIVTHSYLAADSGESPEQMPGGSPLFSLMKYSFMEPQALFKYSAEVEKLCFFISGVLQVGSLRTL